MRRNLSVICLTVGASFLLLSCNEKPSPEPTPSIATIPAEDLPQTLSAKRIFRLSDYYNTSSWVIPDGNGDLKIFLQNDRKVRFLWTKNDAPHFSMKGGAKKTVRIDIPPIGESESIDVPFSFDIPWSLSSDSVPDIYKRLLEIDLYQSGSFRFDFGEEIPFSSILPDVRLLLPSYISPEPDDFDTLPNQNGYRYYIQYYSGPASQDVKMIASFEVPENYQSVPDHSVRLESYITVCGTLRLEKKRLKEGAAWPDHLDFSFSFTHEGMLFRAKGVLGLPSEYSIPDISFAYDLNMRPFIFQTRYPNSQLPNVHLYDTRAQLVFLNKTPFKTRLCGKVASYKNGEVLHSIPFGSDTPIDANRFDSSVLRWNWETVCDKTIFLSEFNRFPVSFFESDYQEHVSLQVNGLSDLFVGDPDDIRFTDLRVERDPDEIIEIANDDFEEAALKLSGQIDTPLQFEKDFFAHTELSWYFPKHLIKENTPLHKAIMEGTISSSLPLNVELVEIVGDENTTISWSKVLLPPSLGEEESSTQFSIQLESEKSLNKDMGMSLLFRLSADETCAGKPINESAGITLSDVVIKY